MHIVVNHFTLQDHADWPRLLAEVESFNRRVKDEHPAFLGVSLAREDGNHAIFLVRFAGLDALKSLSSDVAAPWFAQHFRPLLAGPVDRHVAEVVAGDNA